MDHQQEDRSARARKLVSRRRFVTLTGLGIVGAGVLSGVNVRERRRLSGTALAKEAPAPVEGYRPAVRVTITLNVNGTDQTLSVDTRASLALVLRDSLGLTGTHVTCDRGECGACTVVMDGKAALSCTVLAVQAQGKKILSVEGLAKGDQLDPIQEAFIKHDGMQCGFCTSGQVMSLKALFLQNPKASEEDIRQAVAGNICRCGAYQGIIAAGLAAAKKIGG